MSLRAVVLLGLMAGLFTSIGSLFGITGAALALAGSIVFSFWSYWSAASELIDRTGAMPCRDQAILQTAKALAVRAGIPAPQVFVVDDDQPNALTIGPNPSQSVLLLTSALLTELTPTELQAVIAHELAHIRNRDVLAATLATTFTQAILSLAALLGLIALLVDRRGRPAVIVLAVLAPMIAALTRCALSRSAEYRADRDAALLCGSPEPLISALRHLARVTQKRPSRTQALTPAAAALFIVDPAPGTWLAALLSPHPSVEKRIKKLTNLKRQGGKTQCQGHEGSRLHSAPDS